MGFRDGLQKIGEKFYDICSKQKETYSSFGQYDTSVNVYAVFKDLYDEDKAIRRKDSYDVKFVESCLDALKRNIEAKSVNEEYKIFVDKFIAHIKYNMDLIQLMQELEQIGEEGKSVEEKILFLLNYCIILERTSYFQGLFISKLNELNADILCVDNADYELFYRVGALNFKRHLYAEAIRNLERANIIMEGIAENYKSTNVIEQAKFKKKLLKIKMLRAVSYEFQGDFLGAIDLLVGKTCIDFFSGLTARDFFYSIGECMPGKEESLNVLISQGQRRVIQNVQFYIIDKLKDKLVKGSCLAFASETDQWFSGIHNSDKRKLRYLDTGKTIEYFQNEKKDYNERYEYFQNDSVHEVLHVLAHTLNEYGVDKRNQALLYNTEDPAVSQLLILARALMLYVAKNQAFMIDCQKCLTCLATIFAEVGDFESAKTQLMENVGSNYYKNKNLLVQAETEFFYYLISLMNNPSSPCVKRDEFFNKYSNCCYNYFDYDALIQIEMYQFKYAVATAVLNGLNSSGESDVVQELLNCQGKFDRFIVYSQSFISDWTKNEYDKINIMFQFLVKYYNYGDKVSQDKGLSLVDLAKKYLYLYANSNKFEKVLPVPLLEKNVEKTVHFLDSVFRQPVLQCYIDKKQIQIRNCIYYNLSDSEDVLIEKHLDHASNDADNIYFITTRETDKKQRNKRNILINSNDEQTLQCFLIHCAFDSILYDFVNPQNIFILVPFVNAEPLKYQLDSFDDLLFEICKESTILIKLSQGKRIGVNFQKNYDYRESSNWVNNMIKEFDSVEMVLWDDEVYSKERYYMYSRQKGETQCFPLINYQGFISTLGDIINADEREGKPIHTNCNNDNDVCCQHIILWSDSDSVTERLNSFLGLRFFCVDLLQNNKIIVKYNLRKGQWRIVVVKDTIPNLLSLQAYICNITYEGKNMPSTTQLSVTFEEMRERECDKCKELCDDVSRKFKKEKNALNGSGSEKDKTIQHCYEKGRDWLYELFREKKKEFDSATNEETLNSISCQFSKEIESIQEKVYTKIKNTSGG